MGSTSTIRATTWLATTLGVALALAYSCFAPVFAESPTRLALYLGAVLLLCRGTPLRLAPLRSPRQRLVAGLIGASVVAIAASLGSSPGLAGLAQAGIIALAAMAAAWLVSDGPAGSRATPNCGSSPTRGPGSPGSPGTSRAPAEDSIRARPRDYLKFVWTGFHTGFFRERTIDDPFYETLERRAAENWSAAQTGHPARRGARAGPRLARARRPPRSARAWVTALFLSSTWVLVVRRGRHPLAFVAWCLALYWLGGTVTTAFAQVVIPRYAFPTFFVVYLAAGAPAPPARASVAGGR